VKAGDAKQGDHVSVPMGQPLWRERGDRPVIVRHVTGVVEEPPHDDRDSRLVWLRVNGENVRIDKRAEIGA